MQKNLLLDETFNEHFENIFSLFLSNLDKSLMKKKKQKILKFLFGCKTEMKSFKHIVKKRNKIKKKEGKR